MKKRFRRNKKYEYILVVMASWLLINASLAHATTRPVIYQLVVRHFGNKKQTNIPNGTILENGVGKFSDINDRALDQIKKLNVTHIWLTGVFRQATLTDYSNLGLPADDPDIVKGRAGSFYAIKDYFDLCPDYADDPKERFSEFRSLVNRIHAKGMKVMLDFVGNHVARSYQSLQNPNLQLGALDNQSEAIRLENNFVYVHENQQRPLVLPIELHQPNVNNRDGAFASETGSPGKYVKATGNRLLSTYPGTTSWYETVLLNYGYNFIDSQYLYNSGSSKPANSTWRYMDEVIRTWTIDFKIDGFRADFAHWVPSDFWTWLIKRAKERKRGLLFVAEAYENQSELLNAGFEAIYDDPTYDLLKGITNKTKSPLELEKYWFDSPISQNSLRFLENHDERRLASPIVEKSNPDESGFGNADMIRLLGPLNFLSSKGPILIYNGQTEGEKGEGREGFDSDNGRTSIFDYWTVPSLARWQSGGSFSGSQLTKKEKDLQKYYQALLALSQGEIFQKGEYFGLTYVNRERNDFPSDKVSAFSRYLPSQGEAVVILGNWSKDKLQINLSLPEILLRQAGIRPFQKIIASPVIIANSGYKPEPNSIVTENQIQVNIPPEGAAIYMISNEIKN